MNQRFQVIMLSRWINAGIIGTTKNRGTELETVETFIITNVVPVISISANYDNHQLKMFK